MSVKRFLKTLKPQLIAIVGGSGSGKTWLADKLQKAFGENATRLSLDDFYKDRSHLSLRRRSAINFDHPRAIDWANVERVLKRIAIGQNVEKPAYDFTQHARVRKGELLKPKAWIIMDGLWLLRRPAVRRFFSCRVFIKCPQRVCLRRRLDRDLTERGRGAAQVKKQFLQQVIPMHQRFVAPQLRWANIVMTKPQLDQVDKLAAKIKLLSKTK